MIFRPKLDEMGCRLLIKSTNEVGAVGPPFSKWGTGIAGMPTFVQHKVPLVEIAVTHSPLLQLFAREAG